MYKTVWLDMLVEILFGHSKIKPVFCSEKFQLTLSILGAGLAQAV
jgi:hypothetical protein